MVTWRNRRNCGHCRLVKCFAVGIRGRGRVRHKPRHSIDTIMTSTSNSFSHQSRLDGGEEEEEEEEEGNDGDGRIEMIDTSGDGSLVRVESGCCDSTPLVGHLFQPQQSLSTQGIAKEMLMKVVVKSCTELAALDVVCQFFFPFLPLFHFLLLDTFASD